MIARCVGAAGGAAGMLGFQGGVALLRGLVAGAVPLQARATWTHTTTADKAAADRITSAVVGKFGARIDEIRTANIRSYYWWDGGVQDEAEVRGDINSGVPFAELRDAIARVHPYDVPMIIAEAPVELLQGSQPAARYVRGVFELVGLMALDGTPERVADSLVAKRLVACAQVETSKNPEVARLAFKTVVCHRDEITQIVRRSAGPRLSLDWVPIFGNQPYLDWIDENVGACAAAPAGGSGASSGDL